MRSIIAILLLTTPALALDEPVPSRSGQRQHLLSDHADWRISASPSIESYKQANPLNRTAVLAAFGSNAP